MPLSGYFYNSIWLQLEILPTKKLHNLHFMSGVSPYPINAWIKGTSLENHSSWKAPLGLSSPVSCSRKGLNQSAQGLTSNDSNSTTSLGSLSCSWQPPKEGIPLIPILDPSCSDLLLLLLILHHCGKPGSAPDAWCKQPGAEQPHGMVKVWDRVSGKL